MSLARYVVGELGVLAGALTGLVLLGGQAPATLERLRTLVDAEDHGAFPLRADLSAPPDPTIALEPAGTFLGMSDEILLARVREQSIVEVKLNRGGSTLSFRIELADGSRAAFKPAQTNLTTIPRKEVAAYRLNRLLGLNGVPPAAPRLVSREDLLRKLDPESYVALSRIKAETIFNPIGKTAGVVQYWIPKLADSDLDSAEGLMDSMRWLAMGAPIPADKRDLARQLSDLIVFDFLAANPDRYSGGNMKMSPDGSRLYYMDNTMSFFLHREGHEKNRDKLFRTQRFSRSLYSALGRVTIDNIARALAEERNSPYEILTPSEIEAVVARREVAQVYVASLAQRFGEENVLVFH